MEEIVRVIGIDPGLAKTGFAIIEPLQKGGRVCQVFIRKVADLYQFFGTDEHWVAGKGGEGLVGGIGIAGGAQGEHLPVGLSGGCQKIYELVSGTAQVADAEPARE